MTNSRQTGFGKVIFQNIFNMSDMLSLTVTVSQQVGLKASPVHNLCQSEDFTLQLQPGKLLF